MDDMDSPPWLKVKKKKIGYSFSIKKINHKM